MTNVKGAAVALHAAWDALKDRATTDQSLEDKLLALRPRLHSVLVDVDLLVEQHEG